MRLSKVVRSSHPYLKNHSIGVKTIMYYSCMTSLMTYGDIGSNAKLCLNVRSFSSWELNCMMQYVCFFYFVGEMYVEIIRNQTINEVKTEKFIISQRLKELINFVIVCNMLLGRRISFFFSSFFLHKWNCYISSKWFHNNVKSLDLPKL